MFWLPAGSIATAYQLSVVYVGMITGACSPLVPQYTCKIATLYCCSCCCCWVFSVVNVQDVVVWCAYCTWLQSNWICLHSMRHLCLFLISTYSYENIRLHKRIVMVLQWHLNQYTYGPIWGDWVEREKWGIFNSITQIDHMHSHKWVIGSL